MLFSWNMQVEYYRELIWNYTSWHCSSYFMVLVHLGCFILALTPVMVFTAAFVMVIDINFVDEFDTFLVTTFIVVYIVKLHNTFLYVEFI